ncbi:hypothetical protein DAPPUDRAFT_315928 [Daphnia pulex]|uniref:C-type lectin domain-containing protein n=1 Tax=Daphnia pulex TaxID=6669 RepID=E9GC22_DAPPU|nr:hypothetical protein DAPPUDRAFT_315928 [Daphnia pulex]|eukprot:EFX82923.1 hypothetical protein DAPPUDRAFT_315928 [Daphnia pulex]
MKPINSRRHPEVLGITENVQDPPPPGDCGKYFPYYTSISCWEMGGKCYCASLCDNAFGCGAMVGNWEYAYERCLEQNMTLSTIETQQEDKMIDDFFQLNHEFNDRILWTSGKYSELGSQWGWNHYGNETVAPGTPMGYTNWYPGRPKNNKDGRCLGLVFNDYGVTYENGHWDEFSCQNGYYGVFCEETQQ